MYSPGEGSIAGFNRDPHFQRVMVALQSAVPRVMSRGFNRDPHFQRVMGVTVVDRHRARAVCFNRDPHFQRVMGPSATDARTNCIPASIGTLIFRG